ASAVMAGDGDVFVAGGVELDSNVHYEIPDAEIFTSAALRWSSTSPLATARRGQTMTLLSSGAAPVAGGDTGPAPLQTAEVYDPVANAWSPVALMGSAAEDLQSVRLADGRALVAGGDVYGKPLDHGETYDPATNTWTDTGPYVVPRVASALTLDPPSGQAFM